MSTPEERLPVPQTSSQWEHIPRQENERTRVLVHAAELEGGQARDEDNDGESRHDLPSFRWPLLLFVATCFTTYAAGGLYYSGGIITILLCHEFGHFLQARRYRVPASFPYFIPMPFPPLGTMGAVIAMSRRIPNRRALFDIGISGPLAGLFPALAATWIGLQWSTVVPNLDTPRGMIIFNEPLIFQFFAYLTFGSIPDTSVILAHPLAIAGWAGIFVTALNLIPIGQLDGGHILYAILRRMSYPITTLLLYGAIAVMLFTRNYGWTLIIALLLLTGPTHPPTHNDDLPLGRGRIILGWLTLLFIVIGFTPVPIEIN